MSTEPIPTEAQAPAPAPRYRRVTSNGIVKHERAGVRDLIRSGEIVPETLLASEGSDEWKPATEFPEFIRYFELKHSANAALVRKSGAGDSVRERAFRGVLYPFRSNAILTVLGIAVVASLPIISFVGWLGVPILMMGIVRQSAEGKTEMPLWVDTDDLWSFVEAALKMLAVSLIALWPIVGWVAFGFYRAFGAGGTGFFLTFAAGLSIAILLSLTYYPACLATVAIWDSVLDSLNPVYIVRVMTRMGSDYGIVVVAWLAATGLAEVIAILLNHEFRFIPVIGAIPGSIVLLSSQFYASHILGWAVYRHRHDLGWE